MSNDAIFGETKAAGYVVAFVIFNINVKIRFLNI
jgi:hypothetical protein